MLHGQTAEILSGNVATRVSFNSIDASEKAQPFRQALTAIVAEKNVLAAGDGRDRYGHLLVTLMLNGRVFIAIAGLDKPGLHPVYLYDLAFKNGIRCSAFRA